MPAARQTAPFANRTPAWPVLLAFIVGILFDHFLLFTMSLGRQLVCLTLLLLSWAAASRFHRPLPLILLLAATAMSGSIWHHLRMSVVAPDHIVRYTRPEPLPFQLQLTLLEPPTLDRETLPSFASAWPEEVKSRFRARVTAFQHAGRVVPATGTVLVSVTGELPVWQAGTAVLARGTLRELTPPRNPGDYNFAAAMRREGIRVSMFCESSDAIELCTNRDRNSEGSWFWLDRLRSRAHDLITATLPEQQAAIATALLLGDRDDLNEAQQEAFRRSGLAHLLSISGLHVGLFGLALFAFGRFVNLSPRKVALLTAAGMTFCLLAAELRPPVLRAWILGMVLLSMTQLQRPISLLQGLALSGWAVLLVNPAWLFDTGTHLSFLAVGVILLILVAKPQAGVWDEPEAAEEKQPWWVRQTIAAFRLSLAITIVLLPLLGHTFHRVGLAGIPGTVLALPLLTAAMAILGIHLLWSSLCLRLSIPFAAILTAWPADLLLQGLAKLSTVFAEFSPFNWFSLRPPAHVVFVIYLLAGLAVYLRGLRKPLRPRWLIGWTGIVILLFEAPLFIPQIDPTECECRFLSVGHGNACLIKGPNGQTVLIDGGSMENGERAARAIEASLADMQVDRLSAVVISHTDTDHLNAVPFLLNRLPVGRILVNPAGLTPEHTGFNEVAERAAQMGTPLIALQPGDRIPLGQNSELTILQCPAHPRAGTGDDNADSLVLELTVEGSRLLFPGDVTGNGQQELTTNHTGEFSVLLAPHHGSRRDNGDSFARWAAADQIVVSSGFDVDREHLATVYADRPIAITADGAIRLTIDADGNIEMSQWQPEQCWGPIRSSE